MSALTASKPASAASLSESPVLPTLRSKALKMPVPSTPGNSRVSSPAGLSALVPATRPIWLAVSPKGTQAGLPLTRLVVSTQSPAAQTSGMAVRMRRSTLRAPVGPTSAPASRASSTFGLMPTPRTPSPPPGPPPGTPRHHLSAPLPGQARVGAEADAQDHELRLPLRAAEPHGPDPPVP